MCFCELAGVLYRVLVFTEVCASAAAYFSVQVWTLLLYYDYIHSLTLFRGVFSFEVSKFSRATSANEEKVLEKVV